MQTPTQPPMTAPPPFPAASITTEQIQKYLDENKQLIMAILDNQNMGKLAECAQYQAQLQKNLMFLAAIADTQSPPAARPQVPPQAAIQQGGPHNMQLPQGLSTPTGFPPRVPLQYSPHMTPQQQQQLFQQSPQRFTRPVGANNGIHSMHPDGTTLSNLAVAHRDNTDGQVSKQDAGATSDAGGDAAQQQIDEDASAARTAQ
ncbi:GRF1-interacting factor 3 [Acorus calamus]|uniref:GRF1-interacting factor 3 n=1 Tax=Acorus calamus TaxID=4465 RepID=A0AAV9EA84_ACOCL|nr:GRF1-interacting factor 3 [Acorus calamus]